MSRVQAGRRPSQGLSAGILGRKQYSLIVYWLSALNSDPVHGRQEDYCELEASLDYIVIEYF